jgi:hypothetical protein
MCFLFKNTAVTSPHLKVILHRDVINKTFNDNKLLPSYLILQDDWYVTSRSLTGTVSCPRR